MKQPSKEQILTHQLCNQKLAPVKQFSQVQSDNDDLYSGYLTEGQKAELDRRLFEYQNTIGKTYNWTETVIFIDKKLNEKNF